MATPLDVGQPRPAKDTRVVLKDLVVECVQKDCAHLAFDALTLAIVGLSEEGNTGCMEKVSPTKWKDHRVVQLHADMNELVLIAQSEAAGDLGFVTLTKDELLAFMAEDSDMKLERDFAMEDNSPLLRIAFTIGISQNATPDLASVLNTRRPFTFNRTQNPALASTGPEQRFEVARQLYRLGIIFNEQFKQSNSEEDINKAIRAFTGVVQLITPDDEGYAGYIDNAANAFYTRFEHSGRLSDINQGIAMLELAVACTPEDSVDLPSRLMNLGTSLARRFEQMGELRDIESAISNLQRALQLTPDGHPSMPGRIINLQSAFQRRFEHTGELADIESAISSGQSAVQLTPDGHEAMPLLLSSLGFSLASRFDHTGELMDLDRAIASHQRAFHLTPDGHPDLPARLSGLGNALQRRFLCGGELADIESSISRLQKAVWLTPDGRPCMPWYLTNLGNSFKCRFDRTRELTDIESAISSLQRAIRLTPNEHASMPLRLHSLGISLHTRFQYTKKLIDIENAISSLQRAVQLTPDGHVAMPTRLDILGVFFIDRFRCRGELLDLESAHSNLQKAIRLTPEGHRDMSAHLNNLGTLFQIRFKHTRELTDIESSISSLERARQLTPNEYSEMSSCLINLAWSLRYRFEVTKDVEDIRQATSMLRHSATLISEHPATRLRSAQTWANFCLQFDESQSLEACGVAIELLPQVAGLEQTIHKRHQTLTGISDITSSSAVTAIHHNQFEMALSWLEQGRCLVWNQINQLRTHTDKLLAHSPLLAKRFSHVARRLEVSGSRQNQNSTFSEDDMAQMIVLQDETHTHVHLAKEWNKLLSEIRCLPGFENFLQPPQAPNLLRGLPPDGPIIIFNIHEKRCDAFALISGIDTPLHIPLETFSKQQAVQLRDDLRKYLRLRGVRMREVERAGRKVPLHGDEVVLSKVLRDLWMHVVKPILDALGYSSPPQNRSRIWWCPTGPLSFLPIHAAGIYGKHRTMGSCTSDFVISSYTPTVSALLDKINGPYSTDETATGLLLISQPNTPGKSHIPATIKETRAVTGIMIAEGIESLLLEDSAATTTRVKEEMKTHGWIHFACHAIQDQDEPLTSGVHLHDDRLRLLEIMRQKIPDTDHAFLSACQTSTGDEKLSDEAVHLAAGMLAAGYRGVVATMWSIMDQYAPQIAEDFYSHLLEGATGEIGKKRLDATGSAHALDHSIRKIQEMVDSDTEHGLLTWVPYVHFGI